MQSQSNNIFLSFLIGETLERISVVKVSVPEGEWALSDSLVFQVKNRGMVQVIVELDGQEAIRTRDDSDVQIRGDYADLITHRLEPIELQGVVLPDTVTSIVEFQCYDCPKIIGAEIHLVHGAFSVLFYPEDVDARPSGATWAFVREYALAELTRVVVIRETSTTSAQT
jgi:hypothetical protein